MATGTANPHWSVPVFLVACSWVSVLSTDLYTPSLPHLPGLLDTTEQAATLTMSVNLAAYAVAQLVHGPLADRFGRRSLLVFGMATFAAASAACALAPSIEALIAGRALQGLLSSVPSVVVLLVIHELYGRGPAVRILGFHGMAVAIAPIVGPLIGGYVFVYFGWRANFWLLTAFAAAVAVLVLRNVPETRAERTALHWPSILRNYGATLRQRTAMAYLFPMAANFGVLFAFITSGPFLLIDVYGVATEDYGLWFGTVILAAVIGGMIANRLGGRVDTRRLQRAALAFSTVGVALLVASVLGGFESLYSVVGGMTVFALGLGLMNATGPLLMLDNVGDLPKSAASAVSGSAHLAAASGASLLVGIFHADTALPAALIMAGLTAVGLAGHFLLLRRPQ
ncbi:MAG: Bcr/CflA family efflux MFS transporter [Minwuiales bacterium]|nr:Bcr/CflA family efflux MFS transporter [Minwuiales bacterium]